MLSHDGLDELRTFTDASIRTLRAHIDAMTAGLWFELLHCIETYDRQVCREYYLPIDKLAAGVDAGVWLNLSTQEAQMAFETWSWSEEMLCLTTPNRFTELATKWGHSESTNFVYLAWYDTFRVNFMRHCRDAFVKVIRLALNVGLHRLPSDKAAFFANFMHLVAHPRIRSSFEPLGLDRGDMVWGEVGGTSSKGGDWSMEHLGNICTYSMRAIVEQERAKVQRSREHWRLVKHAVACKHACKRASKRAAAAAPPPKRSRLA